MVLPVACSGVAKRASGQNASTFVIFSFDMEPKSVIEFIDRLQMRSMYSFTRRDINLRLGLEDATLTKALQRLQRSGRIQRIRRGFYVIVPVEYQLAGIIPPDWYLDDLMKDWECPYYVGVLSAASLHGAAHQQPQEYHIVVPRALRAIRTKSVRLRFFWKKGANVTPTHMMKGYTGLFPVSTAAATAFDCVRYAHSIGGLDAVQTVLDELVVEISSKELLETARNEADLSIVQRAGWLLERTSRPEVVDELASWLSRRKPCKTRLDVRTSAVGFVRDPRWQVIANANPESDA
jgi:predicted transcriptional regulator of viral defense system